MASSIGSMKAAEDGGIRIIVCAIKALSVTVCLNVWAVVTLRQ